jgi:hypothetical protein
MRRAVIALVVVSGLVALAIYVHVNRQSSQQSSSAVEDRRQMLKQVVAEQEEESAQAVVNYQQETQAGIEDLSPTSLLPSLISKGIPMRIRFEWYSSQLRGNLMTARTVLPSGT